MSEGALGNNELMGHLLWKSFGCSNESPDHEEQQVLSIMPPFAIQLAGILHDLLCT